MRTKLQKDREEMIKKTREKSSHILIVKAKEQSEDKIEVRNCVRKAIDPLNDPVNTIRATSKGKMVVFCKDSAAMDQMKLKLTQNIGQKYEIDEPKAHKPRIKIVGDFDTDSSLEYIADCIKTQNNILLPFTLENLRHTKNYSSVELVCGIQLFEYLMSIGRLKIGWSRAKIYERINLVVCYKCNLTGHIEKNCESSVEICQKCSGPHKIKECQSDKIVCPNCNRNNLEFKTNKPTNHLPWSFHCPVFKKKHEMIRRRIVYEK